MDKLEHLKIIQAVVSRMATNSFLIKGWCITLVSAILALAAREPNRLFIAIALFPIITFWILDGYFLYQERLFRDLYDDVGKSQNDEFKNYSMDTNSYKVKRKWAQAVFSSTLNLFYITMLVSVIVIFFIALYWTSVTITTGK